MSLLPSSSSGEGRIGLHSFAPWVNFGFFHYGDQNEVNVGLRRVFSGSHSVFAEYP